MSLILGIETSCDETAAAVYDSKEKKLKSSVVFSQIKLHEKYGGVVPEIASRSHLEKIGPVIRQALEESSINLENINSISVVNNPGLSGSLLIGLCFAKGLAWSNKKNLIAANHLDGHIFSAFLKEDGSIRKNIPFPHISLVASGGHTTLYLVESFGSYKLIGETLDDAVGEAFDKVAKLLNLGYPGGPKIEQLAEKLNFEDFFKYPRGKNKAQSFSFSGLKTAVLYDLVKKGVYNLKSGIITEKLTTDIQEKVSSSFLACVGDIIKSKIQLALQKYPEVKLVTFSGGVACNKYLRNRIKEITDKQKKDFIVPPPKFCGDNAAMVAFAGSFKEERNQFSDFTLDIFE